MEFKEKLVSSHLAFDDGMDLSDLVHQTRVAALKVFEEKAITFKKNSTSAMFAKGFMEYINSKQGLEDITIVGCCTDICVLNLAIPLKNYFNEQNIDTNVIVMEDLVETSNNIARVIVKDGQISIQNLTRSSVESSKMDLANSLRSAYELFGCEVEFSGSYPGWTQNVN